MPLPVRVRWSGKVAGTLVEFTKLGIMKITLQQQK
jgi:hypothetical protein